jgi:hypothetical protein
MTPDVALKLASLEKRLFQQEQLIAGLRYESECIKQQYSALEEDHKLLVKDHCLLSDDFLEARKKLLGYLEGHREEIRELAVLSGNTAAVVFPKLDAAWQEIDRVLKVKPRQEWLPRSKEKPSG